MKVAPAPWHVVGSRVGSRVAGARAGWRVEKLERATGGRSGGRARRVAGLQRRRRAAMRTKPVATAARLANRPMLGTSAGLVAAEATPNTGSYVMLW